MLLSKSTIQHLIHPHEARIPLSHISQYARVVLYYLLLPQKD